MAGTVSITLANKSGFSAVSPDPKASVTEEGGLGGEFIDTVYDGDSFLVDVVFNITFIDGEASTSVTPSNVISSFNFTEAGLITSKPNVYTYRIQGPWSSPFTGQFYQYKLADRTLAVLPGDTTQGIRALVRYKMPSFTTIEKTIPFSVTGLNPYTGLPETISFSAKQWIVWRYQSARNNILAQVARGVV